MALDRSGIVAALKMYLKTDATLYGESALVQGISTRAGEYEQAKTDLGTPFKLFLWAEPKSRALNRTQNVDDLYTVGYRVIGLNINPSITAMVIDDIDERLAELLNLQMHNGNALNGYYTDSNRQIVDISYDSSALTVELAGEKVVAQCEGAIQITVNRW